MVYHFVKYVGFDIEAESLEQAKELAAYLDENDCDITEDCIDIMCTAASNEFNVHSGNTEFVGVTEDGSDIEEELYDYLVD